MRALKLTPPRRIALIILLLLPCAGLAQSDLVIDLFAIASGGDVSSGEDFELISSIGQPCAGAMSGGDHGLEGGFLSIVAIPQPGEPPLLRIILTVSNSVIISWPAPAPGWVLQHSSTLDPLAGWTDVGAPVVVNGGENTVTQAAASGSRFYRLNQP